MGPLSVACCQIGVLDRDISVWFCSYWVEECFQTLVGISDGWISAETKQLKYYIYVEQRWLNLALFGHLLGQRKALFKTCLPPRTAHYTKAKIWNQMAAPVSAASACFSTWAPAVTVAEFYMFASTKRLSSSLPASFLEKSQAGGSPQKRITNPAAATYGN